MARIEFSLGETEDFLAEFERAVELSRVEPDSREHAEALAQPPTPCSGPSGHDEARRVVEDAVAAADRSGSAAAFSSVHGIRADAPGGERPRAGRPDATVCWEQALASGDPEAIGGAYDVRLMISYAKGDLRRYHGHAHDCTSGRPAGRQVYAGRL